VAFFGRGGLHCYDVDGEHIWSRDLGDFPGPWGTGASPIIVDRMVIQNCDAEGPSSLLAVDIATGKTIWQTDRGTRPRGGWNTPILINAGTHKELIVNGEYGVRGYDPDSGKELWFCKSAKGRGTPIPAFADGKLYVISGLPGDIYAVRTGGNGDVSDSKVVWRTPRRGGRDIPSPILVGDHLLVANMMGIGSCYDANDGTQLWQARLEGNYSASPIVVRGLVYLQNEAGETLVIKPGDALEIVARNDIGAGDDEIFRSTMVPSEGQLFFRSNNTVYCVGKRVKP
jgi:outer membrane protein assembly factor BamB